MAHTTPDSPVRHCAGTLLFSPRNLELCPPTPEEQAYGGHCNLMVAVVQSSVQTGHGGKWSAPKGGVKKGEGVLQAARREAFEEAGQDVSPQGVIDTYYRKGGRIAVTMCWALEHNPQQLDPQAPDIQEAEWAPWYTLSTKLGHAAARAFVEGVMQDTPFLTYVESELGRPPVDSLVLTPSRLDLAA